MYVVVGAYPVIADDYAEVRGLEAVDDLNELGAVVGVDLGEQTARENAQLPEDRDRFVLGLVLYRNKSLNF
jgi:hypothetical protein